MSASPRIALVLLVGFALSTAQGLAPQGSVPASAATAAAPVLAAPDSSAARPPVEAVSLSAQAAFSQPAARVGDSLDYALKVEWKDTEVPVVVLAPDSLAFTGFKIIGQATVHKKLAGGSEVRNHTEFIYRLRAETQGTGRASSLKLRYLSGISKSEEAVYVPSSVLDIQPAPVRLMDRLWIKLLLWLLVLAMAGALGRFFYALALKKKKAAPARQDLRPLVMGLKSRIKSASLGTAASKDILLEMEAICVRHLKEEAGPQGAPSSAERFEPLLAAHLKSNGNTDATGDWNRLKELFHHARFAGGHKEAHELQDAYKTLKKCLNISEEEEHD
jgi:hypothetical protein